MSMDSNAKIFSVIGGCRRSGRWLVPARSDMLTLFGRAVIDLREAQTSADELEFSCLSVFANITFIVPEGAEVRPSGMAVFGSSRCIVPLSNTTCHLPPISVDATTVFGRIRIRTTEEDPDQQRGRGWLRRRRDRPTEATAAPAATTDAGPALFAQERPDDRGPSGAWPVTNGSAGAGHDFRAAPSRPETSEEASAPPHDFRAADPPVDVPAAEGPGPADPPPDLSAPIGSFGADEEPAADTSPLNNVVVPATIEGMDDAQGVDPAETSGDQEATQGTDLADTAALTEDAESVG